MAGVRNALCVFTSDPSNFTPPLLPPNALVALLSPARSASALLNREILARKAHGQRLRLRLMGVRLSGLSEATGGEGKGTLRAFFNKAEAGANAAPAQGAAEGAHHARRASSEAKRTAKAAEVAAEAARRRGPLDRLWQDHQQQPGNRSGAPRSSSSSSADALDTARAPTAAQASPPAGDFGDVQELVSCPICNTFRLPAGNNAALNEHIDLCLNRGAVQQLSAAASNEPTGGTPAKAAKREAPPPSTLRKYFK